jgi:hypothetical protein
MEFAMTAAHAIERESESSSAHATPVVFVVDVTFRCVERSTR